MKKEERKLIPDGNDNYNENLPAELTGMFDLSENVEGIIPRLPQIKIMHQNQAYVMPDGSIVKEFEAIMLDSNKMNAYWEKTFEETGGGVIPDCFSLDGINPAEYCTSPQNQSCKGRVLPDGTIISGCPKNEYGTHQKGRGKACKNMRRIHVILPEYNLPVRITAPPSNVKKVDDFIWDLSTLRGKPFQLVVTKFSLTEAKNKDGVKYSQMNLEDGALITDQAQAQQIKDFLTKFKSAMRGQDIIHDEYGTAEEGI